MTLVPADPKQAMPAAGDDAGKISLGGPIAAGIAVLVLFFGGFGGWAALAPLESAAVALGVVMVDSSRKTIQHLEGGIVAKILVRDGDLVETGQPLVLLDRTRVEASVSLLAGRYRATAALEARLTAQRNGSSEIAFPDWLMNELDDARTVGAVEGEQRIFAEHRNALRGQNEILQQRVKQVREEIVGLEGQIAAEQEQSRLIAEQLADMKRLLVKQLVAKNEVLELERRGSEIKGQVSVNRAAIARARQSIGETELRIRELETTARNEAASRLREVQTELFELQERLRAAEDVARRTVIAAPQRGIVVGLRVHTSGGVIAPGEALLEIVPTGDSLVVEAKVSPDDIDVVHVGLPAQVRLTAFSARSFVPVGGEVIQVSADHLVDEGTGLPYFLARVALDEASLRTALAGAQLYPGMQAEVMIITGERTTLDYLLQPVLQSFNRAFRES